MRKHTDVMQSEGVVHTHTSGNSLIFIPKQACRSGTRYCPLNYYRRGVLCFSESLNVLKKGSQYIELYRKQNLMCIGGLHSDINKQRRNSRFNENNAWDIILLSS